MTTFYFVRHGETDNQSVVKWKQVVLGNHLACLTEEGVKQLEKTSQNQSLKQCQIILSSPYTRALQSASILSKNLGLSIVVETDLHEWITDKSYSITNENDLLELCHDYDSCQGIIQGTEKKLWESKKEMKDRVERVLHRYCNYESVTVVCHAMVMQAMCPGEYIENGAVRKYEFSD